jgi:hypothetical protein
MSTKSERILRRAEETERATGKRIAKVSARVKAEIRKRAMIV